MSAVAGIVFVAENPADHHVFFKAFADVSDLTSTSSGITLQTPRGEIQVMDPAAFRLHYGTEPPDVSRGLRLAALRLSVREMETARSCLGAAAPHHGMLVVGPQAAFGATLVFERGR